MRIHLEEMGSVLPTMPIENVAQGHARGARYKILAVARGDDLRQININTSETTIVTMIPFGNA